jgi:hypothetical protein
MLIAVQQLPFGLPGNMPMRNLWQNRFSLALCHQRQQWNNTYVNAMQSSLLTSNVSLPAAWPCAAQGASAANADAPTSAATHASALHATALTSGRAQASTRACKQ